MATEKPKRGRPRRPGGPAEMAERFNVDRRSVVVTFGQGIMQIRAAGNHELADEIMEAMTAEAARGKERGWASGIEQIARLPADVQREAWEEMQERGVRFIKRFIEVHVNPPDQYELETRIYDWLAREYPGLDKSVICDALYNAYETYEEGRE